MILYFTGTGNSLYLAKLVREALHEPLLNLNDKIRQWDTRDIPCKHLILVVPTYAWRIPKIVEKWLRETNFPQMEKTWFIMNCGDSIGDAGRELRRLCHDKKWQYQGVAPIVMPENYIAMFHAPKEAEAQAIIAKADQAIEPYLQCLREGKAFPDRKISAMDRLLSGLVNPLFYHFSVKASPFWVTEACIHCGQCAKLCPLNNIRLQDGRPVWGKDCTHCMACIAYCPKEAIEYGTKSRGEPRYHLSRQEDREA